jgi:hypothetical protein
MASITTALHTSKALVRLTCSFATADTGSTVRIYRTIPGGGLARLRLSRGVIVVTTGSISQVATVTDFPVSALTAVAGVYSGVVFIDPEPPQGVIPSYTLEVRNAAGTLVDSSTAAAAPSAPSMGADFLYDLSSLARGIPINVSDFSEVNVEVKSSVSSTLNGSSPIVGLDIPSYPSFNLELTTLTDTEARNMRGLLRYGGPCYALSPLTLSYGFDGPVYFAITGYRESRLSKLGNQSPRRWELTCQQVTPPAAYYSDAAGARAASTAWSDFYTLYAAESWSVVNSTDGFAAAYPVGAVV